MYDLFETVKMADLTEIAELLATLTKDNSLSKNTREILQEMCEELKDSKDVEIKIDAALQKVENLSLDPNLSQYARTQIWSLTSLLESANK